MYLPDRVKTIIEELYERNISLAEGTDDQRRELTLMMGQQTCFELGDNWGVKKTAEGHPQGKDTIAQRQSNNGLYVWDWQDGSSRKPYTMQGQEPIFYDVPDQVFIPVVPINHLEATPIPIPDPNPTPPSDLLYEIYDELMKLRARFDQHFK